MEYKVDWFMGPASIVFVVYNTYLCQSQIEDILREQNKLMVPRDK